MPIYVDSILYLYSAKEIRTTNIFKVYVFLIILIPAKVKGFSNNEQNEALLMAYIIL